MELGSLSGIVDKNEKILIKLKQKFNCEVFSDLECVPFNNFDGFIVATPPRSHYHIAKK